MSLVDKIVAHVLQLEVALYHAHARLEGDTDSEALHDIRTTVRRLRSVLRPLRGSRGVDVLDEAAARLGQQTTPVRDLEVLAVELRERGLQAPAAAREEALAGHYKAVLRSAELRDLFVALDLWPHRVRAAERAGELSEWPKQLEKRLHKQKQRLLEALQDEGHDPHELRLLIKRNRYAAEAYPKLTPVSAGSARLLKAAQAKLGAWHDRFQWCLKAEEQVDLQPLRATWQREGAVMLKSAEGKLRELASGLGQG